MTKENGATKRPPAIYYKIVSRGGRAPMRSSFKWDLPKNGKKGVWTEWIDRIEHCVAGYHVLTLGDLDYWRAYLFTRDLYIVEIRGKGKCNYNRDKTVAHQARLVRYVGTLDSRVLDRFILDRKPWDSRRKAGTKLLSALSRRPRKGITGA